MPHLPCVNHINFILHTIIKITMWHIMHKTILHKINPKDCIGASVYGDYICSECVWIMCVCCLNGIFLVLKNIKQYQWLGGLNISSVCFGLCFILSGGCDRMVVGFTTTCAISAYHHWSCELEPRTWRGVLDTTLCDKVCQWLEGGLWFSPGTPVSFTNKTDCHNIAEILFWRWR
jgi:hypothetical protein